jgi:hypothetical protein
MKPLSAGEIPKRGAQKLLLLLILAAMISVLMFDFSDWFRSDVFYKPIAHLILHQHNICSADPLALYVPSDHKNKKPTSTSSAFAGSYGFFEGELDAHWNLRRAIHARQSAKNNGGHVFLNAGEYFQSKWEPTTSCTFEERVGRSGDGGKWVCNPHTLVAQKRCRVMCIGSNNEFSFEAAVHALNPACEIHTFDHTLDEESVARAPSFLTFHPIGVAAGSDKEKGQKANVLPFEALVRRAGFENAPIDILKIDCEGCELSVYHDLVCASAGSPIRQILMEVHLWPDGVSQFEVDALFETMVRNNYVIFHKEPNLLVKSGEHVIEFSFIKLNLD